MQEVVVTKRKYFGTDGVRGRANQGVMTSEIALKLGASVGTLFKRGDHRHLVIIGKDTRLSGYMIEPALTSGLIAAGMEVLLVGPMPTPAIAMLTKSLRADLGIMISASHNPYYDNGIKIFGPDGYKLEDETELKIEAIMDQYPTSVEFADSHYLGKARRLDDAPGRYIEFVKNTFPKGKRLDRFKLVVDSANGAAYHIAKKIFWELGAEVISIGDQPDGFNINYECGSQHPKAAVDAVLRHGADLGIVLDGDADRLLIIDNKGQIVDGDQIMAVIATHMLKQNRLNKNTVVCTHMSNLGLERYLASLGLSLIRTDVGDRYVAKAMSEGGYNFGGEQSGHLILSDYCSTGDGIIAALVVLDYLIDNSGLDCSLAELLRLFEPVPQILHNIKYQGNVDQILSKDSLLKKISQVESRLGDQGRLLIRRSGTEPIVRIMIEYHDLKAIKEMIKALEEEI